MGRRSALFAFLLAAAAGAAEQSLTLKIEGFHSKGDAYKVELAVRGVNGVRSATADAAKKELVVVFDDAVTSEAEVRKAISAAGYTSHR
jgi:copper chaperone CopZ